jgi:hypothetical protein
MFSIFLILPAALGPGIHSASNRNDCQKEKNSISVEKIAADNLGFICEPILYTMWDP